MLSMILFIPTKSSIKGHDTTRMILIKEEEKKKLKLHKSISVMDGYLTNHHTCPHKFKLIFASSSINQIILPNK